MKREIRKVETALQKHGLLLVTDQDLPSVTTLIAGEAVKGSWWGHPKGNLIYNLINEFLDRDDVIAVKLLNRKITLIHQRHWDALYTIATSKTKWQFSLLQRLHIEMLKVVGTSGRIRARNELGKPIDHDNFVKRQYDKDLAEWIKKKLAKRSVFTI